MSPNTADTSLTIAEQTRTTLKAMGHRLAQQCPDLRQMARDTADQILLKHTCSHMDPDDVYWHRFDTAVSSPRTFNGWQHVDRPIESLTLPQLTLHRFDAKDQDASDQLQMMSGFYTTGPSGTLYNEHNEVRMLPVDVMTDFWELDFCTAYQARMDTFWHECAEDYRTLAKTAFLARAVEERNSGHLAELDFQTLIRAVANNVDDPLDLAMLQANATSPADIRVTGFDIGGYLASDILCITTAQGRQILYLPGDIKAFKTFATPASLHQWLLEETANTEDRARFLGHFPLSMRQENGSDVGLDHLMDLLPTSVDSPTINTLNQALGMDAFAWLRDAARVRMNADAAIFMHSNSDLRKQMWIGYLNAFSHVMGPLAAIDWPIALALVGAGLADLGLNIDQAVNSSTTAGRKAGVIGAIACAIDVLFNSLALLAEFPDAQEFAGEYTSDLNTETNSIAGSLPEARQTLLQDLNNIAGERADPLAPFQTNVLLNDSLLLHDGGHMQGIYQLADGSTYISIKDHAYRVRYANETACWIIIDPQNPFSFYQNIPTHLNPAGQWQTAPASGLRGGGPAASRPRDLPTPLTTSEYDVPQSLRPQLLNAANGNDRRALMGEYVDSNTLEDPYRLFRPVRERLQQDARAFFSQLELPVRRIIRLPEAGSTAKSSLQQLYAQAPGLVIGESHADIGSKRFLIDNMRLLSKMNVRTLYMEHLLTDFHLSDLRAFAESGEMSSAIETYLKNLDVGHGTDPTGRYTFLALVKAARENHMRIQPLDCMASYRLAGVDDPSNTLRNQTMNYFAHGVIQADAPNMGLKGKWIALVGNSHANTFQGVPGISELDGAIGIRVEDVAPGQIEGFSRDPGKLMKVVTSHKDSLVKCDFRLKIAVTRAEPHTGLENRLMLAGMFAIDISGDKPMLIHRAKNDSVVRTVVKNRGGKYSINRPVWPAVSGRDFDSLGKLVDALKLMGMRPVS